jgi:hypothetical protein
MKRRLIYLYTFIGVTILLSSANFLKSNHNTNNGCVCAKEKRNREKASGAELFLPLHFISIIK